MLGMTSCDPVSDPDRGYHDIQDRGRQQELFRQALMDETAADEAIEIAKRHVAPDGAGTVEEWIDNRRMEPEGEIMFPRWETRRTGPNRYEVRYTYTFRGEDLTIEKRGFAWEVDTMIDVVGDMTILSPEDIDARTRRILQHQERMDQIRDEFSLE